MKMRASLFNALVLGTATLFSAAMVFLFLSQDGRIALRQDAGRKAGLAAIVTPRPAAASPESRWADAYGQLPMGFEENKGQTDPSVRFISHGEGYELFLTPQEAVLALRHSSATDRLARNQVDALRELRRANKPQRASILRMRLAGASSTPEIAGLDKLPGRTDYFTGNNARDWRTEVPSYSRVSYRDIYPGVDLVFYGNKRHLEYDFVVSPGADPTAIALDVAGARKLRINTRGNVVMSVSEGEVELQKPVAYQDVNGKRREIAANYAITREHRVQFAFAEYDRTRPLVVDPVLNYSTFLGGSISGDVAYGIAVDANGNAYLAGETFNTAFPASVATIGYAPPPSDPGVAANGAAFVSELNAGGTQELYFSYLGGSGTGEGEDLAYGVALDSAGSVYVTGQTFSTNFPTMNGLAISGSSLGTGFITKLNPAVAGSASLLYSSYLGGTGGDLARGIAVDASQNAYIVGLTRSSDFPVQGAYQTTLSSPSGNAFLTRIDTTQTGGSALLYSTYLGGNDANSGDIGIGDWAFGVAVDSSANAYLAGVTTSTNSTGFPVGPNTYQTSPPVANATAAAFVSRVDTTQSGTGSLVYSTYLAGSTADLALGVAVGANRVAYVTGQTSSTDFPVTAGSYPSVGSAEGVAFVSLLDTTQTGSASLKYSTYLGGGNGDVGEGIGTDSSGNAYVTGGTDSIVATGSVPAFPLTPGAFQTTSTNTQGNAFISEISPNGNGSADLIYSTLLGGSGNGVIPDRGYGIALDSANNVYVGGQTASTDFPVFPNPGAFQTTLASGSASAFAAKLTLEPTLSFSPATVSFGTVLEGTPSSPQTLSVTNNTGIAIPYTLTVQGTNAADFAVVTGGTCAAGTLAASSTACTIDLAFTPTTLTSETGNLLFQYTAYGSASSQIVALTGTGTSSAFSVSPTTFTFPAPQFAGTTSAPTTITLTNGTAAPMPFTTSSTDVRDFTISSGGTMPCPASGGSIPANSSCTFNATLNPASGDTGTLTTTFSVTANASTQTAVLTGIGQDFNFSPPTQSVSVAPGASASPTVTANFLGGFTGPVTLSCSGAIPQGACTVPGTVSASGSSSVAVPVTVTITTKGSSIAPPASLGTPPASRRQLMFTGFAVLLLFTAPFVGRRRARLGLVGALVMIVGLAACSGSSGTPAGAYNLTITGTANGATRTAAITLNVT